MTDHPLDNTEHSVRASYTLLLGNPADPFPFADKLEATVRRISPPRFRDHMTEIEALLDGTHPRLALVKA